MIQSTQAGKPAVAYRIIKFLLLRFLIDTKQKGRFLLPPFFALLLLFSSSLFSFSSATRLDSGQRSAWLGKKSRLQLPARSARRSSARCSWTTSQWPSRTRARPPSPCRPHAGAAQLSTVLSRILWAIIATGGSVHSLRTRGVEAVFPSRGWEVGKA